MSLEVYNDCGYDIFAYPLEIYKDVSKREISNLMEILDRLYDLCGKDKNKTELLNLYEEFHIMKCNDSDMNNGRLYLEKNDKFVSKLNKIIDGLFTLGTTKHNFRASYNKLLNYATHIGDFIGYVQNTNKDISLQSKTSGKAEIEAIMGIVFERLMGSGIINKMNSKIAHDFIKYDDTSKEVINMYGRHIDKSKDYFGDFISSFDIENQLLSMYMANEISMIDMGDKLLEFIKLLSSGLNEDIFNNYNLNQYFIKNIVKTVVTKLEDVDGLFSMLSIFLQNNINIEVQCYDDLIKVLKKSLAKKEDIRYVVLFEKIFNLITTYETEKLIIRYIDEHVDIYNINYILDNIFTYNDSMYIDIVDRLLKSKYRGCVFNKIIIKIDDNITYINSNTIDHLIKIIKQHKSNEKGKIILNKLSNVLLSNRVNSELETIDIDIKTNNGESDIIIKFNKSSDVRYSIVADGDGNNYNFVKFNNVDGDIIKYIKIYNAYMKVKSPHYTYTFDYEKSRFDIKYMLNEQIHILDVNIIQYCILYTISSKKTCNLDVLVEKYNSDETIIKRNSQVLLNTGIIQCTDNIYSLNELYGINKQEN